MELKDATHQLSALAQENRLAVFRLLVRAGDRGLPAGEIASALNVPPNTLSSQLNILANAGLIEGNRQGRSVIYVVKFERISALLVYLMQDCCDGRPEVCAPVHAAAGAASRCSQSRN
jgi:ArsR family transcriptional regulator